MEEIMKKILIITSLILISNLFANPILPGPEIEELYWDGEDWHLVMKMRSDEGNLNQYYISCKSDSSYFVDDYLVDINETIIITNSDLQNELNFDQFSDNLTIYWQDVDSYVYEVDWFVYNPDGSWWQMVNFPDSGNSIRWINYLQWDGYAYSESRIHLATDANSIYFNDGESQYQGVLSGYIYDNLNNPVENANVQFFKNTSSAQTYFPSITSDENGYYECQLSAKKYFVTAFYNARAFTDTILTINPNETTSCDLYLELSETGEEEIPKKNIELKNIPNPFNPETVITYEIPQGYQFNEAHIEIFNSRGQKIISIPVDPNRKSIQWRAEHQASGVYFYSLKLDGKEVDSEKMLLLK